MYVVVNFLSQVIFIFPLFLGMVIYANEFETKEKQKLPELKNLLQHIYILSYPYSLFTCCLVRLYISLVRHYMPSVFSH